jgi:molybdate transport system ATP-binding protein
MLEIDVKKKLRDFDLDVSLKVEEGEILMLVGENGCGKSTLLNMVAGLLSPDAGEILLAGEPLFASSLRINLSPEMRNIGYVFQNYALFPHLSVYENVAFGLRTRRFSRQKIEEKVKEQLKAFDLWGMRDAKAVNISGGQKQRTALARALAIEPRLLLLDEPLAALDIRRQAEMRKELRNLIRDFGVPSIVVTHDLRDVVSIGDIVSLMAAGRVIHSGPAEEVFNAKPLAGAVMPTRTRTTRPARPATPRSS